MTEAIVEDSIAKDAAADGAPSVRVIERVMQILKVLAETGDPLTLTELSRRVGLHKSTVLRFLKSLERGGFAVAGKGGKGWRVGPVFADIRTRASALHDLPQIARPIMEETVRLTGETVQLATLPDTSVVYIAKVEPLDPPLRINTQIGTRRPIHCTALGKVLAAAREPAEVDAIIGQVGMPGFTARTITSRAALHEALAKARAQGFSVDDREFNDLVTCVAAPVRNAEGRIIAGVSVSSFGRSVDSPDFADLIAAATSTGDRISAALGWTGASNGSRP